MGPNCPSCVNWQRVRLEQQRLRAAQPIIGPRDPNAGQIAFFINAFRGVEMLLGVGRI